jgi:hypothetical protein
MKKLLALLLLACPLAAAADNLDVIEIKLKDGCDLAKYLTVVKDFNVWAKDYGYHAEVLSPIQRMNLETIYWVGRSKDAETFGHAWDTWRDAQSDPDSVPAKLWARMSACEININRAGYDTYK